MLTDEQIKDMELLGLITDIRLFCEFECPFDECKAPDKDPLKCWMIQKKFNL